MIFDHDKGNHGQKRGCHNAARFLGVFLLVFSIAGISGSSAKTIRLVTGNEYAPFTDEKLPHGGLATLIVKTVYERLQRDKHIAFRPWKRGYQETLSGRFDATFPYIYTEERGRDYYYSSPMIYVVTHLFVIGQPAIKLEKHSDLIGKRTCLPSGYANSAEIEKMVSSGQVERVTANSMAACFRRLSLERVDFVEVNNFLAPIAIRDSGINPELFERSDLTTDQIGQYIIFPKTDDDALENVRQFDYGLELLRKDGDLSRIIHDYLIELNWKP